MSSSLPTMVGGMFCLLLVACSQPASDIDPALYANDSLMQTFDRHVRPRRYWSEKIEQLQARENQTREQFRKGFLEYQNLLRERRNSMVKQMVDLKARGKDPNEGRKEAINRYRQEVDRLRNENRELAKQLMEEDQLLSQAQKALIQSR